MQTSHAKWPLFALSLSASASLWAQSTHAEDFAARQTPHATYKAAHTQCGTLSGPGKERCRTDAAHLQ